ncbi:fasciclin-like arabinogalactan protein 6 [Oryza brachyantha]|nr:fasciclin-like arabinogalactan protein 6 [Oryza brachyantha]
MASPCTVVVLLLPFIAAAAAVDDAAPAPASPQLNLTGILEKGGQYSTLLRLLNATRVNEQLSSQLRSTYDGLTVFAPTDAAFAALRPGTLNGLTDQEQVQLMLYHVLPRYYSLTTFQTASNPLRTQASGPGGVYTVNVTTTTGQSLVNVSTGLAAVPVGTTLFAQFPLAVYSVDGVLLPEQMSGAGGKANKAPAPAPASAGKAKERRKGGSVPKNEVVATAPTAGDGEDSAESTNAAAVAGAGVAWGAVWGVALVGVVNLVMA